MSKGIANLDRYIHCKSKNARVSISIYKNESDEMIIFLNTKRLVDFKERKIIHVDASFGVDTFACLYCCLSTIFESGYANKEIVRRLKSEWKGSTDIK